MIKYYEIRLSDSRFGLLGATFAYCAKRAGKKCLVIDKRPQLGGNVYCEQREGINVHKYGAHIFHTSNKEVWDFGQSVVRKKISFWRWLKDVHNADMLYFHHPDDPMPAWSFWYHKVMRMVKRKLHISKK